MGYVVQFLGCCCPHILGGSSEGGFVCILGVIGGVASLCLIIYFLAYFQLLKPQCGTLVVFGLNHANSSIFTFQNTQGSPKLGKPICRRKEREGNLYYAMGKFDAFNG